MLFEAIDSEETLSDDGTYQGTLAAMVEAWNAAVAGPLQEAGLAVTGPAESQPSWRRMNGKRIYSMPSSSSSSASSSVAPP